MIADQIDDRHALDRGSRKQSPQDAGGIDAAIDVVADMQQQRRIDRPPCQVLGDGLVKITKLHIAAMDVADGVDALASGQARGCT